jgi:hypothetical protein
MGKMTRTKEQFDVVFLFGDPIGRASLYQLKQWIEPLERLTKHCKVAIVTANSEAAEIVSASGVASVDYLNLDDSVKFLTDLKPKVVLYPSKGINSLKHTQFPGVFHVFVGHGESDKAYSSDNSLKYFDYVFTAGEMAIQRIREEIIEFDADKRCIKIGRPQLLNKPILPPDFFSVDDGRKIILYAPTADFVTKPNKYGSVGTHGISIVEAVLAQSEKYRLIYKPHPLAGKRLPEAIAAHQRIVDLLAGSSGGHLYDTSEFGWQAAVADFMISDISAVTYDWLATGKPFIVTKPSEPEAWVYPGGILGQVDLLSQADTPGLCDLIEKGFDDQDAKQLIARWSEKYYFSPVDKATGLDTFIAETLRLVDNAAVLPAVTAKPQRVKHSKQSNLISTVVGRTLKTLEQPRQRAKRLIARFVNTNKLKTDNCVVHFTNATINLAFVSELSRLGPQVFVINSLPNYLKVATYKILRLRKFQVEVLLAPNVLFVSSILSKKKPSTIYYLSHSDKSHFGVRHNKIKHILYCPDRQSDFWLDHNVVSYDEIQTTKPELRSTLADKIFRPDAWSIETIS